MSSRIAAAVGGGFTLGMATDVVTPPTAHRLLIAARSSLWLYQLAMMPVHVDEDR